MKWCWKRLSTVRRTHWLRLMHEILASRHTSLVLNFYSRGKRWQGSDDERNNDIPPAAAAIAQRGGQAVEPGGWHQYQSVRGNGCCRKNLGSRNGSVFYGSQSAREFPGIRQDHEAPRGKAATRRRRDAGLN